VKFTPEEKSTANMALFFLADGESAKQQTGSISGSASKVCYLDRWMDLGYWWVESGSIVVNGNNLSTFLATDYSVDYENGLLMIKTGNSKSIADLAALTIAFTYADYSVPMFVQRTTPVIGFLRYRGTSEVGPRHSIKCWKVQITPDSAIEFIKAQDYSGLSFSGDVFDDDDTGSHSENPSFEVVEITDANNYPVPTPGFSFSLTGYTCQITDESSGEEKTYDYDWGDGSAHSTEANPSHIYAATGKYNIVQTVTDANGSASLTKEVNVAVLVAWYKGENNPNDSSPNGLNMAWTGAAGYTTGVVGNAFNMTGTNYLTTAHNALLNFAATDKFYFDLYFKTTDVTANQELLQKRGAYGFFVLLQKLYVEFGSLSFTTPIIATLSNNVWCHAVVAYNNKIWKVTVDNNLIYTSIAPGFAISQNTVLLSMGGSVVAGSPFFRLVGAMDEVKIYIGEP